jgi:hypothetical protein
MLTIRRAQITAFEEALLTRWMLHHVARHFPALAPAPATISACLTRARAYGFAKPADLCRFVDLCCALGEHFERDPAFPWAAQLLHTREIADASERLDLLAGAARAQLRAAAVASRAA